MNNNIGNTPSPIRMPRPVMKLLDAAATMRMT
jgi:hypothetical protein